MPLKHHLFLIAAIITFSASAQISSFHFPQEELNKFNAEALQRIRSGETVPDYSGIEDGIIPAAGTVLKYRENWPQSLLIP